MNNTTRYHILDTSLKVEQLLSELIKNILRIKSESTKTLDNKSSSLTYKAKTDLLFDLGEINKYEYNIFIKFSEIRNQFVHVLEVREYIDLPLDLQNYLNKKFPCKKQQAENLRLTCSYDELQATVVAKIKMLSKEYDYGQSTDYEKYIALEQKNRITDLLEETKEEFDYAKSNNGFVFIEDIETKSDVEIFIDMFLTKFRSSEIHIRLGQSKEELELKVNSRKKKIFEPFTEK